MGPDTEKGEILSTWKEIAAYLNIGVRTCIRWEKENGLPVHRQEGAPRSRIFAYKGELDAWFKSRLGNGSINLEPGRPARPVPGWLLAAFALVLLGAAVALVLVLRPRAPAPAQPVADDVPASFGSLLIRPGDIVETEFAGSGRMRLWRQKREDHFFEAWRIEPVRHSSLAVGNLDDDADVEIVAPGYCREYDTPGDLTSSKIRFFLNAYKREYKDWWKTTFFDVSQCIYEKDNYESVETIIADVDGAPGNEILMATAHALSVFKYDARAGELRLLSTGGAFVPGANLLMRSIAASDIDGDGGNEILLTAQEGEEGAEVQANGWLFVLRWRNGRPEVAQTERLPGMTAARAMRLGDIVPGGPEEAVIACSRDEKGFLYGYVVGWSFGRGFIFEKLIDEVGRGTYGALVIDVGDLSPKSGDEVVVARNNPGEVISLFWQDDKLVAGPKHPLDHNARVNNIRIGPPVKQGAHSSLLVSGTGEWAGQAGRFYLELMHFGDGFLRGWVRTGGEKEDLRVSYAEFINPK